MVFLIDEIRTAYESAYSDNNLMAPKKYVEAKIYHGGDNFDISKRWYVYYSYIDNKTGKMKRQPPITFSVNRRFKTKDERLWHLTLIKKIVNDFLKKGWTPDKVNSMSQNYTAESCLDYALSVKKTEVKSTTFTDYESRINQFKEFLKNNEILKHSINDVTKRHISKFLNTFDGAKNRNNYKIALNSVFKVLSDESYIEYNFISEIRNKKVVEKPITLYPFKEIQRIENLLQSQNYSLMMYIRMESYIFWRPLEIVRIKDSDIDFNRNVISVETKTDFKKTKIIPTMFLDEFKAFVKNKKGFIFQPENTDWELTKETNRRGYYTTKFRKFRNKNGIDSTFKMYHFKHFYITKIYLELRKERSKEDSIKKLSLITGHKSKAIHNYILVNDVELPEDYSEYLKHKKD